MDPLIETLHERRLRAWEQTKGILAGADAEGRDLSAEESVAFERANADLNALDERLKSLVAAEQRAADTAAALEAVAARPAERAAADESADAAALAFFRGETSARSLEVKPEGRALSKLTAGAGGNTVPTNFYDRLSAHMIEVSGILQAGPTVLRTADGAQIQIPKTTSHSTAALVAEAGTIGASDPAFGQVALDAYKYAFLIQVSHELISDTSVDLLGYLSMQAGRALGNAVGAAFVTGTGSSQPQGIVPVASAGVTGSASVSGAFSADNLIDLYYSVIAPYRNSASCAWMMRDTTLAAVRKLKGSDNNYLWQPGLQAGAPDMLLGKPVVVDPNVAAVALSAKSVVFGDFSQFFVRFVEGIRFERSDDYAFNTDLVTYRAILRADSDLVDTTGAVKVFTGNAA